MIVVSKAKVAISTKKEQNLHHIQDTPNLMPYPNNIIGNNFRASAAGFCISFISSVTSLTILPTAPTEVLAPTINAMLSSQAFIDFLDRAGGVF